MAQQKIYRLIKYECNSILTDIRLWRLRILRLVKFNFTILIKHILPCEQIDILDAVKGNRERYH